MEFKTASSNTPVSPNTAAHSGTNPATESAIKAIFTTMENTMFSVTIFFVFLAPLIALGRAERLSPASTKSLASIAASLPKPPIAAETVLAFMTGVSLMPSPT